MSNPENLIRPAVLTNVGNPTASGEPTPSTSRGNPQATPDLLALITNIVSQVITENQNRIQVNNDTSSIVNDQTIDEHYRQDLRDLDKVPDIVRSLREFSGSQGEFASWKKSVDRVLAIYEHTKGMPKYYGILSVIRNKITGSADAVLESYNTPLDWSAISRCLTAHYADKRDLGTLEYQLTGLVHGRKTVHEFYQEVYSHLSLILNNISCMDIGSEAMRILTKTYRDKALDTFVRGLSGDLSMLLGARDIVDLPQALQICSKLENQNFRASYAHQQQHFGNRQQSTTIPPIPPRKFNQTNRQHFGQKSFYPELVHTPQNPRNTYNQRAQNYGNQQQIQQQQPFFAPPRPVAPKPQPQPEAMEVDMSIRTNRVNYANRPQPFRYAGKRGPGSARRSIPPQKMQRNFNIEAGNYEESPQKQPNNSQSNDFEDIHFLG